MTQTETETDTEFEHQEPETNWLKRGLIVAAIVLALVIGGAVALYNSGVGQRSLAKVDFLTEIENTFGVPQFNGATVNENGDTTLRDAYIACAVGSEVFMNDWIEADLPEGVGLLFLDIVFSSDICENA